MLRTHFKNFFNPGTLCSILSEHNHILIYFSAWLRCQQAGMDTVADLSLTLSVAQKLLLLEELTPIVLIPMLLLKFTQSTQTHGGEV